MVICYYKLDCSTQRCSYKSRNLKCIDLFLCSTQCEKDEDSRSGNQDSDDTDAEDDERDYDLQASTKKILVINGIAEFQNVLTEKIFLYSLQSIC